MTTKTSIQSAINNGHKWHVISENEVHSFGTKKEAIEDKKWGESEMIKIYGENVTKTRSIELISEKNAVEKYS